mmetsp:Transcript_5757/g.11761  ORF Transcript_5757/g.11761 Transcript_5757/m.11761 type:complete len:211 (-) Transcript_5757:76-708(-)
MSNITLAVWYTCRVAVVTLWNWYGVEAVRGSSLKGIAMASEEYSVRAERSAAARAAPEEASAAAAARLRAVARVEAEAAGMWYGTARGTAPTTLSHCSTSSGRVAREVPSAKVASWRPGWPYMWRTSASATRRTARVTEVALAALAPRSARLLMPGAASGVRREESVAAISLRFANCSCSHATAGAEMFTFLCLMVRGTASSPATASNSS